MSHVPADRVAFWSFDDPAIPTTERDTAATAIAAAALLKLAQVGPEDRRARYRDFAEVTVEASPPGTSRRASSSPTPASRSARMVGRCMRFYRLTRI